MVRLDDWEPRLMAQLDSARGLAFQWGRHDCCTFAAACVLAMTGTDPMPEFRGHYRTARGSVRALRGIGAGKLAATLDAKFAAIAPALAHRGDLVMADGSIGIAMGDVAIFVGAEADRQGLVRVPRADWTHAWRVAFHG